MEEHLELVEVMMVKVRMTLVKVCVYLTANHAWKTLKVLGI